MSWAGTASPSIWGVSLVRIRVIGDDRLIQRLRKIDDGFDKTAKKILRDSAFIGEAAGKRKIRDENRIDTGRMMGDYRGDVIDLTLVLTSRVDYFIFQDRGTRTIRPANATLAARDAVAPRRLGGL